MPKSHPLSTVLHNNGHLLCAVDLQTSGPLIDHNSIMQMAFIPLKANYEMNQDVPFFDMRLRPEDDFNHPSVKCKKESWLNSMRHGVEPTHAADLFEIWFNKLSLSEGKKIVLLGHNIKLFDIPFLRRWLGPITFDHYFHWLHRDVLDVVLYLNDLADWRSEPVPFAKYSLTAICNRTDVSYEKIGDAKLDAYAAAQVYPRLLNLKI